MKRVYAYIKENEEVTLELVQGVLADKVTMSGLSESEVEILDDYFGTRSKDEVVALVAEVVDKATETPVERPEWVKPIQWSSFHTNALTKPCVLAQKEAGEVYD